MQPGDLIAHQSIAPTRLNPSFGAITYADNDRYGNYNSIYFDLKGRFSRGFLDFSYTRSKSKDDALAYPDPFNPRAYYAPSIFDVPNRFSLSWNYSLRGLNKGSGAVRRITGGWGLSGTTIFQSGYPFTARNLTLTTLSAQTPRHRSCLPVGCESGCGLCAGKRRLQRGRQRSRLPRCPQLPPVRPTTAPG